jgi:hypothetical protein
LHGDARKGKSGIRPVFLPAGGTARLWLVLIGAVLQGRLTHRLFEKTRKEIGVIIAYAGGDFLDLKGRGGEQLTSALHFEVKKILKRREPSAFLE